MRLRFVSESFHHHPQDVHTCLHSQNPFDEESTDVIGVKRTLLILTGFGSSVKYWTNSGKHTCPRIRDYGDVNSFALYHLIITFQILKVIVSGIISQVILVDRQTIAGMSNKN